MTSLILALSLTTAAHADTCEYTVDDLLVSANDRDHVEFVCDIAQGEVLVGVFTEDHAGTWSYWLDGVGILCAPSDDLTDVRMDYLGADIQLTPGEVNEIPCASGATGVVTNEHYAIGRSHIDAVGLTCDGVTTAMPAQQSPSALQTPTPCDPGDVMVGIAYEDYDNHDNLGFSDAVAVVAPICAPAVSLPTPVVYTAYTDNTRDPISLYCGPGQHMTGAFYDNHAAPVSDWMDGIGITCADDAAPYGSDDYWDEDDISGARDVVLDCGNQGVNGLRFTDISAYNYDEADGMELLCGSTLTSTNGGDIAPAPAGTQVTCGVGEVAVGLQYKDEQTATNQWSDGVDQVTLICAPATCP